MGVGNLLFLLDGRVLSRALPFFQPVVDRSRAPSRAHVIFFQPAGRPQSRAFACLWSPFFSPRIDCNRVPSGASGLVG
jgi:hypothetical protein